MPIGEYIDLGTKGLLAFAIPIGWAIILYPLSRKLKQSWPFLLAIATVLSLALLVLKELMDWVTPAFDPIVTYILGIFFSVVALSLLFHLKTRWLMMTPRDNKLLPLPGGKEPVHLRHILHTARAVEAQGVIFYEQLAAKATQPRVRDLCYKLAQDETDHRKLMEQTLSRWLSLPPNKETISLFTRELTRQGVFLDPPPPDAPEETMVKFAIAQENKTADFYLSFEKSFPEAWKQMQIQTLVMQERDHANELMAAYPQFV